MGAFKELWQNRRFRVLWIARLISNFGNGMAPTAIAFAVLDLPGGDASALGIVLAAQSIPIILLLPLGGVIADRLPRALVIATTDLILSVVVVAQGVMLITGTATVLSLSVLNVFAGILNALWWPAFPGLVPAVMAERDLQRANAAIAIANNAGLIAGSALAGILITVFGSGWAILIDGITFTVAGALVWTLRHVAQASPSGESIIRDLRDGWSTFMSYRWVWVVVAAFSIIVAAWRGAIEVAGPVLMKQEFNGAASWAIVQTASTVGMFVGAIVAARIRPARPLVYCMLVTLTMPAWMLVMAVPLSLWVIVLAAFSWGFAIDQWGVLWGTALQTHVPRESLSRVSSFDAMGSIALGPVGLAVTGPAIAAFGLPTTFVIAAVVVLIMILLPLLEPTVRNLGWVDPEPEPVAAGPGA